MAESTLSVSLTNLRSYVSSFYGFTRTYGSLSSDEAARVDETILRGLRKFYQPNMIPGETKVHEWSFLKPIETVTTQAPYSTGTITVASGVVTLASGTFPAWAAAGEMHFGGGVYTVNTRDGNTQVTLDDTTATASAGTTYVLCQPQQDLADDFGGIASGGFTFPAASGHRSIPITQEHRIRDMRQRAGIQYGVPAMASIRVKDKTTSVGSRYEVVWWPVPDAAYILSYRMNVLPDALVTTTNEYPYGGAVHGETIIASCLAVAELQAADSKSTKYREEYAERLASSIMLDRQLSAPDTYGYNDDRSDARTTRPFPHPCDRQCGTALIGP